MKYCLKYDQYANNWHYAEEVSIKYVEDKGLVKFLELLKDKRIILLVPENFSEIEVKKLIAIKKIYPQYNFALSLLRYNDSISALLRINNISFFEEAPCCTWERFNFLAKNGVSDIVIGGDLGFSLPEVKHFINKKYPSINIRAIADMSTTEISETDPLKGFFIRPEDVSLYAQYVDIIEFCNPIIQDRLFEIYKKGFFMGKLNQIIFRVTDDINEQDIPKAFGEKRINCKRKCLKGSPCNLCHLLIKLTKQKNIKNEFKELD
jgi:hypothetical protein